MLLKLLLALWILAGWWPGLALTLTWAITPLANPNIPTPAVPVILALPVVSWIGGAVLIAVHIP